MTASASQSAAPALALLGEAAQRVNRTVDGFHGDDWRAPSLLPGWTRAHVVAHLALNAEALGGALRGLLADEPTAMYPSDAERDADIEALAEEHHSTIRERLLGATTLLHGAFTALPEDVWGLRIDRTPGGRSMRVSSVPSMRLRELEIHHVDLGTAYTTADWSAAFSEILLDAMTRGLEPTERLVIRPLDVDRTWEVGPSDDPAGGPAGGPAPDDGAVVTGPAADLGWWLTGRPAPQTLSSTRGQLPEIGAW